MAHQLYWTINVGFISDGISTTVQINLKDQPVPIGPAAFNTFDMARNLPMGIGLMFANLPTGQVPVSASLSGPILTVVLPSVPAAGVDFGITGQLTF